MVNNVDRVRLIGAFISDRALTKAVEIAAQYGTFGGFIGLIQWIPRWQFASRIYAHDTAVALTPRCYLKRLVAALCGESRASAPHDYLVRRRRVRFVIGAPDLHRADNCNEETRKCTYSRATLFYMKHLNGRIRRGSRRKSRRAGYIECICYIRAFVLDDAPLKSSKFPLTAAPSEKRTL